MRSTTPRPISPILRIVYIAIGLTGCATAPERFVDGVGYTIDKQEVTTARAQRVADFPCVRVNAETLDDLHRAMACDDLVVARDTALRFIDGARQLSIEASQDELDRLDDENWAVLAEHYFAYRGTIDDPLRTEIHQEYLRQTDFQYRMLRRQIVAAESVADVRSVLALIEERTRPSIKDAGRVVRALPWMLFSAPAAIVMGIVGSTPHLVESHAFESSMRLVPSNESSVEDPLLARFAPVIVQEIDPDATYAQDTDRIGAVVAADDGTISVDATVPTIYAYTRSIFLNGAYHKQLIYAWWFPRHPQLKAFDPEAGDIEGATLRITLDRNDQPAVLEVVFSCGCYHAIYPTRPLDTAAAAQFGAPLADKRFSIERPVAGKFDAVVDEIIELPAGSAVPEVHSRAAEHRVSAVGMISPESNTAHDDPVTRYKLRQYRELERLKTPSGRVVSMFEANGLVRGAQRLEGAIFTPIGMLSAGQPRQRGTQMTQFDQYDFDDPRLLERLLRLPEGF